MYHANDDTRKNGTQFLKSANQEQFDYIISNFFKTLEQEISYARNNPKILQIVKDILSQEDYLAFISGNFKSYEQFDKVFTTVRKAREISDRNAREVSQQIFTQILNSSNQSLFDKGMVDNIEDTKKSLEIARQDSSIIELMEQKVNEGKISLEDYLAFIRGQVNTFEQIDRIQSVLTEITNKRKR